MEKEQQEYRSPRELNTEFRKILAAIPAVHLGMLGTIMDSEGIDDLQDDELLAFKQRFGREFNPEDEDDKFFAEIAKGDALIRRREKSFYTDMLLGRVRSLLPFVAGTNSFRDSLTGEVKRLILFGIDKEGKENHLYGNEEGGIFDSLSVAEIEEKSLQILHGDFSWYGVSPFIGRLEAFSSEDPAYQDMLRKGRNWVEDFKHEYGRTPNNKLGDPIEFIPELF